jgi:hypothetical protein
MKNTKRGLLALLALLALSAIGASSASALATTSPAKWWTKKGGVEAVLSGSQEIGCSLHPGTTATLNSEVGSPTPQPVELSATGMECLGATIENKKVTEKPELVAFGTGKIKFTGVTVTKPAGCVAEEPTGGVGHVTTNQLNVHADFMDGPSGAEKAVQQFIPTAGVGAAFASFRLENATGKTCPVAGLYAVKGTLYTNAAETNPAGTLKELDTGFFKATQLAAISPAIETTDGGGLTIGSKAANLTGIGAFSLLPVTSPVTEFTVK